MGNGVKDSINAVSRRSRDQNGDVISPDDGIQTMRAESNLETAGKNVKLKATKAESCMNTSANIVLVPARGQGAQDQIAAEGDSLKE